MQCHAKPCPPGCMSRARLCIDIITSCLFPSVCDWNSTSDKAFHASFQGNVQAASYSSGRPHNFVLNFLITVTDIHQHWSWSYAHGECGQACQAPLWFPPWLCMSQSRLVCGKCLKKRIYLFCRSKSQPTWCIIVFITCVMIIEFIWCPTRRLIACFVDDRAIICKAAIIVSFL